MKMKQSNGNYGINYFSKPIKYHLISDYNHIKKKLLELNFDTGDIFLSKKRILLEHKGINEFGLFNYNEVDKKTRMKFIKHCEKLGVEPFLFRMLEYDSFEGIFKVNHININGWDMSTKNKEQPKKRKIHGVANLISIDFNDFYYLNDEKESIKKIKNIEDLFRDYYVKSSKIWFCNSASAKICFLDYLFTKTTDPPFGEVDEKIMLVHNVHTNRYLKKVNKIKKKLERILDREIYIKKQRIYL